MQQPKQVNRFVAGMNKDVNPSMQPENTYRDAVNMDISLLGEQLVLNTMRSVSDASASGGNAAYITIGGGNGFDAQILGRCTGIAKISGVDQDCVAFFAAGVNGNANVSSRIFIFALSTNTLVGVGGTDFDLGLQTNSAVSAFITRDRGRSFMYFTDGINPIRRLELDDAIFPTIESADELNVVRSYVSDNIIDTTIQADGTLAAGTYQFSYRLKNSLNGSLTKWSSFTNPVPIIPNATPTIGGTIGEITDKSVLLEVVPSVLELDKFDQIEFATIKNTTGDRETQTIAFISTIDIDPMAASQELLYDGGVAEYELPLAEIVVDDAPVESAVCGYETNGRSIYGNIRYFDRRLQDDQGALKNATTIKEALDYNDPENCENKKGYFRDEVYRFGITYHDQYGNWSPVKPLDFTNYRRTTLTNVTRVIKNITQRAKINTTYNLNTFTVTTSTSISGDFASGDVVMINFGTLANPDLRYFDVFSTASSALVLTSYEDLPVSVIPTPSVAVVTKCLGNAFSHSASSDWKFADRSKFGYQVLDDTSTPKGNAIGLRVTIDGLTHPSWAIGFAIVRMERDRNIVYQTPLVPATQVVGVITPGKNTLTNKDYTRDSRNIGEFDHLAPKAFALGVARGMGVSNVQGGSSGNPPLSFEYPEWRDTNTGIERWDSVFAPAVDFVANAAGRPLIDIPADTELNVKIKDVVGLLRRNEELESVPPTGYKTYRANLKNLYFHNGSTSNYSIENGVGSGIFNNVAFPRIQDTIACFDQSTQDTIFDITDLKTDFVSGFVQSGAPLVLPRAAQSNLNAQQLRANAGTSLVGQQRTSTTSIPPESLPNFTGDVDGQRTLVIGLNEQFLDPLWPYATRYNSVSVPREWPWRLYAKDLNPRLYNGDAVNATGQIRGRGTSGVARTAFNDSITAPQVVDGDIANAVYVANLELGKSDFRYGSINRTSEYIFTGAYHKIVDTADVTLDVWGGDCFISKFVYKVNDAICIPRVYNPVSSGTDISFGTAPTGQPNGVAKTGVANQAPEFIEIWMESEANFGFVSDKNRYPFFDRNIFDYTQIPRYDYNFGYSIDNTAKKFFSEDRSVEFIRNFPARVVFSDARVFGTNDDGYSRFRALNFKDLEEKYGGISGFGETQAGNILATQKFAIRELPIGKTIVQDENGTTLALQSGQFISDYISYVTTAYGSSNPNLTLSTEEGVFILDENAGALLKVSGETKMLQLGKMEGFFNQTYSNVIYNGGVPSPSWIQLGYDKLNKELHIIGYVPTPTPRVNWLTYNGKLDAFVSRLAYTPTNGSVIQNRPFGIVSVGGRTFLLQTRLINKYWPSSFSSVFAAVGNWKGGNTFGTLMLGGSAVNSEIEYVCNADVDTPKTFDIVGSNSFVPFTSYSVTAFNDGGQSETTGTQTTNISTRDGVTYAPFIRDNVAGGRLRGVYATIKLTFSNTSVATRIYSLFTQIRKSFR